MSERSFLSADRTRALSLAEGQEPKAANIERVAQQTSNRLAAWAFLQWELRDRAKAKDLPHAGEMLYIREALEQASHFRVAQYHASLFPEGALVADLTSGIGSDLLALAARGPVRGYEIDPERLEYASWNLEVNGFSADFRLEDSTKAEWDFEYAVADPARRVAGKRFLHQSGFVPHPDRIVERADSLRLLLMKLSPMLSDTYLESFAKRLEFVSYGGECREALAFLGTDVEDGRFAVHIESGETLKESELGITGEPLTYLYEADPAAIRAHALGSLSLVGLGDSNGYLTGSDLFESVWTRSYRVLASGRFDQKTLRSKLRELNIGEVIVKSRTSAVDVTTVAKQLKGDGRPGIVAFYQVGKSIRYAVIERC